MRTVLALAAAAATSAALFAAPAHAEQVNIGVTVANNWSATAFGTSTHPGEVFGDFTIYRVTATNSLTDPHVATGGATVAGFAGSTAGVGTYVVNAHPMDGDEPSPFFFTSVVVCTKVSGTVTCQPGVGEHTVISALTGP